MKLSDIAEVCHEVNRAYCESIGDFSQVPFKQAPAEIQASALRGVVAVLRDPEITPNELHEKWMRDKADDGWVYGETKCAVKKTHPCMVPYYALPEQQRTKDHLFRATARTLARHYEVATVDEHERAIA